MGWTDGIERMDESMDGPIGWTNEWTDMDQQDGLME